MKIKTIKKVGIEPTWDIEVQEVNEYLLDNNVVSHNTSATIIKGGATESVNPPKKFVAQKSSGIKAYQIAPEFWKYRQYYKLQYEVPNSVLLKLAQIRQLFLDQGQSIDLYYNEYSAYEVIKDIMVAQEFGLKSLYYANSRKEEEKEVCESCSS